MKISCIVPGSKLQVWKRKEGIEGPQKADDMFIGRYSIISKKYAQKFFEGSYYYLTTKQGLLSPDTIVPGYEITKTAYFDDPGAASDQKLAEQFKELNLDESDLIVFLGTKGYIDKGWAGVLETLLGEHKDRLFCPLGNEEEDNFGIARIKDAKITGIPLYFSNNQSPVRLKKVEMKKLFETYDYPNISLFSDEKLTIIVAPNGFGKTTLMETIYRIFSLKTAKNDEISGILAEIQSVPFESVRLVFDNNSTLVLYHSATESSDLNMEEHAFCIDDLVCTENSDEIDCLVDAIPFIPVKFIKSTRLTEYSKYTIRNNSQREEDTSLLKIYSHEIIKRIESLFSIYAEVTDDYECTALSRLTEKPDSITSFHRELKDPHKILTQTEAIVELEKLKKEREFLRNKGFLKVNSNLPLGPKPEAISDDNELLKAVTLHICDSKEKYQLFELLKEKINLLQEIINDLFLDKKLRVNYENGFEIIRRGKVIDLDRLSSGEQHQIILYYDLIFNSEPGTLVLIDEPEISIHIEWQRQFLRNLDKISNVINADFIVTTHSPDIVNDKWNQIIQLSGDKV